jgi:hypothetical protein
LVAYPPGKLIQAGAAYTPPDKWTRDNAINAWNATSFIGPVVGANTLWAAVDHDADGGLILLSGTAIRSEPHLRVRACLSARRRGDDSLDEAVREGIIDRNPARVTGWQNQYQRAQDELDDPRSLALCDWEALTELADALVDASYDHYRARGDVVVFTACTACRIGEASGVRVGAIDTRTWIWTVRHQTTTAPGSPINRGRRRQTLTPGPRSSRRSGAARPPAPTPNAHLFTGPAADTSPLPSRTTPPPTGTKPPPDSATTQRAPQPGPHASTPACTGLPDDSHARLRPSATAHEADGWPCP